MTFAIINPTGRIVPANPFYPPPSELAVMLCGDSMTYGGDTDQNDKTLAYRGVFWDAVRQQRGGVRLLGQYVSGMQVIDAARQCGPVKLGDWHVTATGGWTLQQIAAATTAAEASQGTADAYVLLGGENNIAAGDTAAQILALITSFVAARRAANRNAAVLVCTLTPHAPPLADYAARNAVADAVNAGLAAAIAPYGGIVVDAGSLLTWAELDGTGNHPNGAGYAKIGASVATALLQQTGGMANQYITRRLEYRKAKWRAALLQTATSGVSIVTPGGDGLLPAENQSWSFGVTFYPTTTVYAAQKRIVSLGAGFGAGVYLLTGPAYGGANGNSLQLYIDGVSYFVHNDGLKSGKWTKLAVSYNHNEAEISIYALRQGTIAGQPCSSLVSQVRGVPALNLSDVGGAYLGHALGIDGAEGYYGDFWIANGSVVSVDQVEAGYWNGALPDGCTAHYEMSEGGGVVLAPSPGWAGILPDGSLDGTGAWLAPNNTPEPWDRGQDA